MEEKQQRPPARTFEDLMVWQKAHELVLDIYRATEKFPRSELYGLTSPLRRAAVSVAANIAEGFRRRSKLEKIRFFNMAQTSAEEVRYYLILSRDLKYMDGEALMDKTVVVCRMLESYIQSIQRSRSVAVGSMA